MSLDFIHGAHANIRLRILYTYIRVYTVRRISLGGNGTGIHASPLPPPRSLVKFHTCIRADRYPWRDIRD